MRSVEAVNGLMFTVMFPLTFLANTFAPTENMPTVLRTIAEWNPVSALAQAVRAALGQRAARAARRAPGRCSTRSLATLIWTVLITAVMAPLSLRAFKRRTDV